MNTANYVDDASIPMDTEYYLYTSFIIHFRGYSIHERQNFK